MGQVIPHLALLTSGPTLGIVVVYYLFSSTPAYHQARLTNTATPTNANITSTISLLFIVVYRYRYYLFRFRVIIFITNVVTNTLNMIGHNRNIHSLSILVNRSLDVALFIIPFTVSRIPNVITPHIQYLDNHVTIISIASTLIIPPRLPSPCLLQTCRSTCPRLGLS